MSYYGYLAHHGIKGQKWGVRRYENPDGTLTEEGKKRYGYKRIKSLHRANRVTSIIGSSIAAGGVGLGLILTPETAGLSLLAGAAVSGISAVVTTAVNRTYDKKIDEIINKSDKNTFNKIKKDKKLTSWYDGTIAKRQERERTPEQQKRYEKVLEKYYYEWDKLEEDLRSDKINVNEYDELANKLKNRQDKELGSLA